MKIAITAAVVLGLALAPAAHADTLFVGGTGIDSRDTRPTNLGWANHGGLATQVGYPAALTGMDESIGTGVSNLDAAVRAATGPITIVAASQGAVVADQYKQSGAAPEGTTFVLIGDPTSRYGIMSHYPGLHIPGIDLTFTGTRPNQYTTTVISRQYDGVADWPSGSGNAIVDFLAYLNALAGIAYIHPNYGSLDTTGVTPVVDGNTTYYRLPSAHLPLLQPLRDLGIDQRIVNAIEGPLRQIIDSAYRGPTRSTATVGAPTKKKRTPSVTAPAAATKPVTKPNRPALKQRGTNEHRQELARDEHRQSDQRRPERRPGNVGGHGKPEKPAGHGLRSGQGKVSAKPGHDHDPRA